MSNSNSNNNSIQTNNSRNNYGKLHVEDDNFSQAKLKNPNLHHTLSLNCNDLDFKSQKFDLDFRRKLSQILTNHNAKPIDLCKYIDIKSSTIYNYLKIDKNANSNPTKKNKPTSPTVLTLYKIAQALGMSMDEFFDSKYLTKSRSELEVLYNMLRNDEIGISDTKTGQLTITINDISLLNALKEINSHYKNYKSFKDTNNDDAAKAYAELIDKTIKNYTK